MGPEPSDTDAFIPTDFSKIKVGIKSLDDAVLQLGSLRRLSPRLADKHRVLMAMHAGDLKTMREISDFFYKTSGIYSRLCRYLAYLYRYDWMITPYLNVNFEENEKSYKKAEETFYKALNYFDNFEIKKFFGEVALKVVRYGCYYGYLIPQSDRMVVQELPVNYCRSRFFVNNRPAVEFNMRYFDDMFSNSIQRMQILKLFPDDFKRGYIAYKEGKLPPQFDGDESGWYLLEVGSVIKFNINGEDAPFLMSVIPAIIDLDAAQDLDKKKMAQRLLKIIIQKMPIDKNGDLVFDVEEARELHNNAVKMLGKAVGLDVLTTFADVDVANMDENTAANTDDAMERNRQNVYDEAGISQLQFNSDGNIALNNSILNDEATMYNLISQFEGFLNDLLMPFNKSPKKLYFRAQILSTTIYNYKELSKMFKEHVQLGYSKMLPQIALGQSQSTILANAKFENVVLDLFNVFIPPMSSNTMSADALNSINGHQGNAPAGETKTSGRPEKEDSEKTEKTIANKESAS